MGNWVALVALAALVGAVAGSASALFLWALARVTALHGAHPQLLWFLPVAGALVGLAYHHWGKGADRGNNLLIDEIHQPGGGVPARMAPLVLTGTLVTHLFGGSAGREGTAVQMGGSLAGLLARWLPVGIATRRMMLQCGIAAGFGAVFGTPLTGAIFALEVLIIGRMSYEALIPALVASVVGDATCTAWGIHHTLYHLPVAAGAGLHAPLAFSLLAKVAFAACAFGLAARFFATLTHSIQKGLTKMLPYPPLRPLLGGLAIIALVFLTGSRDFLGLGVEAAQPGGVSIVSSFEPGGATPWSWFWKTVFTAVTVGSGFKGGEVTPLFFIGSTLGHALAVLLQEPAALFAALGFIAVFAGASNTPLTCTVMGVELFGSHYTVYFALACFIAYFCSGPAGIYAAQRNGVPKSPVEPPGTA